MCCMDKYNFFWWIKQGWGGKSVDGGEINGKALETGYLRIFG